MDPTDSPTLYEGADDPRLYADEDAPRRVEAREHGEETADRFLFEKADGDIMRKVEEKIVFDPALYPCRGYPCLKCSGCENLKFCSHEADHFGGRGFGPRRD